jgi:tetratricopeptide (TPR) repeat protein
MNNLAKYYIDNGKPEKAEWYAKHSIEFFPAVSNHINLGVIRQKKRDFEGAKEAYMLALKMVPLRVIYENIAIVNLSMDSRPEDNIEIIKKGLSIYPNNNRLWNYLAIEQAVIGNQEEAKNAILNAYRLGPVPPALYESIMNKTKLDIPMPDSDRVIHITWGS